VTTVQSLRNQGAGVLEDGLVNLRKHIEIVRGFQLPALVAINRFPNDTAEELARLQTYCAEQGAGCAFSEAFAKGGSGATQLAEEVVRMVESSGDSKPITVYSRTDSAVEKITRVARVVYGATGVEFSEKAQQKLARFTEWGFGDLPVCIAKTQYSLSDDPALAGAPTGWTLHITDIALSAGAGFLVAISGNMMLMPGLPKESRAIRIDVDSEGEITGLT